MIKNERKYMMIQHTVEVRFLDTSDEGIVTNVKSYSIDDNTVSFYKTDGVVVVYVLRNILGFVVR